MTTVVKLIGATGEATYEVRDSVAEVTQKVKDALENNEELVGLTDVDGQSFSVQAGAVSDVRED